MDATDASLARLQAAARITALCEAVDALDNAGQHTASKIVLDMIHAERSDPALAAFISRNEALAAHTT